MLEEINKLREELKAHLDDWEWLSQTIMILSSINIDVGQAAAQARLAQESEVISIMGSREKVTKTAAESEAIVNTQNEYEGLDNLREDIGELVNSIKKRIDVLSWDRRSA